MSDERLPPEGGGLDEGDPDEIDETEIEGADGDGEGDAADGDGAEDGTEGEGQDGQEAVAPRSRRASRADRARAEARELRDRVERVERENAELRIQRQQPPADPGAAQRAEAEWWERTRLLPPDEMVREIDARRTGQIRDAFNQQQLQINDRIDRGSWAAAARVDPVRGRYTERVEAALASERAAGRSGADRETIFTYLYGQDALKVAQQRGAKQRVQGQRRVAGQQTRPGGGRSDVPRNRQQGGDSIEAARARLAGRALW